MDGSQKDTKHVAVAFIKNEEGKYLMIKPSDYKDFGQYQDAWYPLTGHVKFGETIESALRREAKEELNLEIKPIRLVSKWNQDVKDETAYWWECKIVSGDFTKNEEISEYAWYSPEELKSIKLWPAERSFFEKFLW